jgi:hypothetical protein
VTGVRQREFQNMPSSGEPRRSAQRAEARAIAALAGLLLVATPAAAADTRPRLAVLDLVANGASKELASATGGVVANELDRLGVFKVVTSDAIRALLALEKQRQMLGCTDASCLTEIGGALGVDYLVSGKVSRLAAGREAPERLTLELTLSSVRSGQGEGSAIETAGSEGELQGRVARAVGKLVARVLAGRSGTLVVASSEAGAVVKVDEQVKGTTPLQGVIPVPSGTHALSVEKDGFVAFQKEIQVLPGKLTEERAALAPSPDFIRSYESRQKKLRVGAWIASGLAVAGATAAILLQADASRLYGNDSTAGTFLYDRRKLLDGVYTENGVDLQAQANRLKSQISQRQTLTWVAAGAGAAGAATATWLWIAGDDPGRYARYRVEVAAGLVPRDGGLLASVVLGY